ncbi:MAG: hypothetical protein IPF54_06005 [Draconibacterium sp.]|nr:hypothetical protein [Draconibacterium sp.]
MKPIITVIIIVVLTLVACEKEGLNGFTSLIDIQTEPVGENCNSGGLKIISGIDLNNSGILDMDEIDETKYICNGQSGSDGILSLMNILPEPAGENCYNGGYKIISGLDMNQNSNLDENEIQNTEYMCQNGLGKTQTDFQKDVVYQAKTDGILFVNSYISSNIFINPGFYVYADSTNNPSTTVAIGVTPSALTIPIQKGLYWKVVQKGSGTLSISWISLEN